jgi:hypothetical protein
MRPSVKREYPPWEEGKETTGLVDIDLVIQAGDSGSSKLVHALTSKNSVRYKIQKELDGLFLYEALRSKILPYCFGSTLEPYRQAIVQSSTSLSHVDVEAIGGQDAPCQGLRIICQLDFKNGAAVRIIPVAGLSDDSKLRILGRYPEVGDKQYIKGQPGTQFIDSSDTGRPQWEQIAMDLVGQTDKQFQAWGVDSVKCLKIDLQWCYASREDRQKNDDVFLLAITAEKEDNTVDVKKVNDQMISTLVQEMFQRLSSIAMQSYGNRTGWALGFAAQRTLLGPQTREDIARCVLPALLQVLNERVSFDPNTKRITLHCFERLLENDPVPNEDERKKILTEWTEGFVYDFVQALRTHMVHLKHKVVPWVLGTFSKSKEFSCQPNGDQDAWSVTFRKEGIKRPKKQPQAIVQYKTGMKLQKSSGGPFVNAGGLGWPLSAAHRFATGLRKSLWPVAAPLPSQSGRPTSAHAI